MLHPLPNGPYFATNLSPIAPLKAATYEQYYTSLFMSAPHLAGSKPAHYALPLRMIGINTILIIAASISH